MINWTDPAVIAAQAAAFTKFVHSVVGIYFWEYLISLDFDWSYLTGKRTFKWPMAFYFLNRYMLLAVFCCLEINCKPLYSFMQVAGNMAGGFASINLAIRTMAIWNQNKFVVIPLVIIILGHWSLILQGGNLKAVWILGQGCVITQTGNTIFAAQFIYSMCFDLIVLVLSGWKLAVPSGHRSHIVSILFRDGLVYFIVALLGNIVVTVFQLLDLNPIMSVFFNVPSIMVSTIAATRAVRNLQEHVSKGPEMFSGKQQSSHSGLQFGTHPVISVPTKRTDGVHVQVLYCIPYL
ncbi:hypothetical protein K474DRAFT_1685531 [Panus rudis PR-1116 ss-1]|nr:hypothetical protein K474DRAFT_1685531 [Panus rudis PR-1116 ss-1]